MTKIFKYPLSVTDEQKVTGPALIPLSAGMQRGELQLWATVDEDEPDVTHTIVIQETGNEWSHNLEDLKLIGRVEQFPDNFIWHIFSVVG